MRGRNKGVFIGVVFLLIGISILLKVFFNIHIPVFRTFFAVFIIYVGIKMLLGDNLHGSKYFSWQAGNEAVFSDENFGAPTGSEDIKRYHTVFGSSRLDLRGLVPKDQDINVEVNTVFGESRVLIDPGTPVKIMTNSVFAEARTPDGNIVAFGNLRYASDATKTSQHFVKIHGNVVFGSLRFSDKDGPKKKSDSSKDSSEESSDEG